MWLRGRHGGGPLGPGRMSEAAPTLFRELRAYAKDALLPRDAFGRALLTVAVLRSPIVWFASMLLRHEPVGVTALYRPGGDVQYLELVSAIGRGNLGESQLYESLGAGMQGFPLGSMWIHAAFFALAKIWGLLVADVLVTILGYVAYSTVGRAAGLGSNAARGVAGGITGFLFVALAPITDRLGWGRDLVWGERFPRPFVTEIYVACFVAALLVLHRRHRDDGVKIGSGFWIFGGVLFSLLLQSDIYSAFILALASALVLGRCALAAPASSPPGPAGPGRRGELLRGLPILGGVVALTVWPFLLQRRAILPEVMQRWGAYPLSRVEALAWARYVPLSGAIIVVVLVGAVWLLGRRVLGERTAVLQFFAVLALLAAVALPLFFVAIGQGLFPYHLLDRARRFAMTGVVFVGAIGAMLAVERWELAEKRWLRRAVGALLVVATLGAIGVRAREIAAREYHTKTAFRRANAPPYRTPFTALARELASPKYEKAVVLGTLDQQVHIFWQMQGGRSFVPDGWESPAPDAEVERRLVLFCRLVGLPTEDFLAYLQRESTQSWVFNAKYQTNSAHAIAPLDDYTVEQRARIVARSIFVAFQFEVPVHEMERFRALYEGDAVRGDEPRLDVVVLVKEDPFVDRAPPDDTYALSFENELFRVYLRRESN